MHWRHIDWEKPTEDQGVFWWDCTYWCPLSELAPDPEFVKEYMRLKKIERERNARK
jgi:hypothetical protein